METSRTTELSPPACHTAESPGELRNERGLGLWWEARLRDMDPEVRGARAGMLRQGQVGACRKPDRGRPSLWEQHPRSDQRALRGHQVVPVLCYGSHALGVSQILNLIFLI